MWEIWKEDQYLGTTSSLQIAQVAWERGMLVYYYGSSSSESNSKRDFTRSEFDNKSA